MKTTVEISNGVKRYKLLFIGDATVFIDNEREESLGMSETDFFDIIDDQFQEVYNEVSD